MEIILLVVIAACSIAAIHTYLVLRAAKRESDQDLLRELRLRDIKGQQRAGEE